MQLTITWQEEVVGPVKVETDDDEVVLVVESSENVPTSERSAQEARGRRRKGVDIYFGG